MGLVNALKLHAAEALWMLPRFGGKGSDIEGLVKQLVEDGCCAIPGFLTTEQVDRLVEHANQVYATHESQVTLESNDSDQRVYGVEKLDSAFVLEDEFALPVRIYSRFDYSFKRTWFQMLGKITYKEGNLGSGSGWHRDSPFRHQFKAILYLCDVTEGNGPFEYIKGTHTKQSQQETAEFLGIGTNEYRFTQEQISKLEVCGKVPKRSTITGERGTLLMADVHGLHWGKPLQRGERLAVTRYFFSYGIPAHFAATVPPLLRGYHSDK